MKLRPSAYRYPGFEGKRPFVFQKEKLKNLRVQTRSLVLEKEDWELWGQEHSQNLRSKGVKSIGVWIQLLATKFLPTRPFWTDKVARCVTVDNNVRSDASWDIWILPSPPPPPPPTSLR